MFNFLRKNNNTESEWRTVAELKVGQSIAVPKNEVIDAHKNGVIDSREWIGDSDVLWDEIESIEYVGTEQVWDIEVEGTHNFVGNNIFAHNTYITGSLGLGTSSPYAKLSVAGSDTTSTLIGADALSGFTGNLMELKLASTTKFSVSGSGFGTTTVAGLNISGSATSTSNVGFNLTGGCFAVGGNCLVTGDGALGAGTIGQLAYFSGTNTAVGTSTLYISTAGNVGIGTTTPNNLLQVYDLVNFDNDNYNTSLGYQAGKNVVAGATQSVFVGYQAGLSSPTLSTGQADNNTGLGTYTLYSNSTGYSNTAVGIQALFSNTSGYYNTSSGNASLFANTIGHDNTAYGSNALFSNSTGSNNVALGSYAGKYETGSDAFYVDDRDRTNTAGDKAGALLYGTFNATPASQTLTVNASTTIAQNLSVLGTGNSYFAGKIGIGTTTPSYALNSYSATASQLALSAGAGVAQWAFRNAGGDFFLGTTTVAGTATTSTSAFSISGSGFGTTTIRGLNIIGQATSTSNVGFNITGGCFAVGGTCIGSGSSLTGTTGQLAYFSGTNTAIGTSTIFISTAGNVGIGSASPTGLLSLQGAGTAKDLMNIASSSTSGSVLTISQWGGFIQKIASTTAMSIQMASGTPVFEIDTTASNSNSGLDITAATGQTSNLLNMYSSGGTFLSGFTAAGGLFMNMSSSTAINMYDGSGNAAFVVSSSGKSLGVGTSTLTYNLNVAGSQASTYIARIDNSSTANTADGLLISLGVANASRGTGNYFIGFANGSQTVAGKIQGGADAVAYTTTAADLAEYFRISDLNDAPKPGEIVVLDISKNKSVLKATSSPEGMGEPLGIISTNPGFIGNGPICYADDLDCDTEYAKYNTLVSLVGQVPVKISLENGPIVVGDYLTLSTTTPGVAVKMVESGFVVGQVISEATTTSAMGVSQELMVNVFIKNGWREIGAGSLATNSEGVKIPGVWNSLFKFFKQIGFEVGQNFIKIANLVTDKITAQKVETKELCIEDVCVNKEQLQALILNSQMNSNPSTPTNTTTPVVTEPVATSTPPVTGTTTPEIVPPTEPMATTPTEIISSPEPTPPTPEPAPVVEPAPTPTSEPAPVVEPTPTPEQIVVTP